MERDTNMPITRLAMPCGSTLAAQLSPNFDLRYTRSATLSYRTYGDEPSQSPTKFTEVSSSAGVLHAYTAGVAQVTMGGGCLPAAAGEFEEAGCAAAPHHETHRKSVRVGGWGCGRSRRMDRGV